WPAPSPGSGRPRSARALTRSCGDCATTSASCPPRAQPPRAMAAPKTRAAPPAGGGDADAKEPLAPEAEWLLDNFFVIEDVLREVRKDLPRGYYDELPLVTTGPWGGLPRIYALAVALITHTDSHLDDPAVLRFVQAFQDVARLTTGDLWPVQTMLRLALLENLRRLGAQMLAARAERLAAVTWVERAAETL